MITMILISSVAMLVGIVGSIIIWRFDALRADEIEHAVVPAKAAAISRGAGESAKAIGLS